MRFIIFVLDSSSNSGNAAELREIDQFNAELVADNRLIQAVGIAGPERAKLIDNRNSRFLSSDASANGETFYSGFWLITADHQEQAEQLAHQASLACNRVVELRPLLG